MAHCKESAIRKATEAARAMVHATMTEHGFPAMTVAVSMDGELVWDEAFGLADVENNVPATTDTLFRVGSVSKCLAMAGVAKLVESGRLDLDRPIRQMVSDRIWPKKQPVVTVRQLASHTAGLRSYNKKEEVEQYEREMKIWAETGRCQWDLSDRSVTFVKEFINETHFKTMEEAVATFNQDELLFQPGEGYYYSNHGFTLMSAVVEAIVEKPFGEYIWGVYQEMGLKCTFLNENGKIIPNRARPYNRHPKTNELMNSLYVDKTQLWAPGGIISTVKDLVSYGNTMLYSFQAGAGAGAGAGVGAGAGAGAGAAPPTFLRPDTVRLLWTPVVPDYGLGWRVSPLDQDRPLSHADNFMAYHSGETVGGAGHLMIVPDADDADADDAKDSGRPRGVVVSLLSNVNDMYFVYMDVLSGLGVELAKEFEKAKPLGKRRRINTGKLKYFAQSNKLDTV